MISRSELQVLARRQNIALGTLEKDYVLTQVLLALSEAAPLNDLLVFKGGTALRKVFFTDWRYSEDLDFTVKRDMNLSELKEAILTWYNQIEKQSQIQLTLKMLYKPDGYARIRTQYSGPLSYPAMIFMDLSFDEPLCLEPELKEVIASPFSGEKSPILVYPLEELLAEKIRSLIERGKSRDYYDVWRLLKEQTSRLDISTVSKVLAKKLKHKGIILHNLSDFLPEDIGNLKQYWERDLAQQISKLPPLNDVLEDLPKLLNGIIDPLFTK